MKTSWSKAIAIPILAAAYLFIPDTIFAQDTDGDGMPDSYENAYGCLMADTADGDVDYDSDSLTSLEEYVYSPDLDPCDQDTDADGVDDGAEVAGGSNPLDSGITPSVYKTGNDVRLSNAGGTSSWPFLVWTGSEFEVSWQDIRDGNSEIYFTRVSAGGTKIGDDVRLTADAQSSNYPSFVWTGSELGLSWSDNRDGNNEIYFTRVSAGGTKIGGDIRLTTDGSSSTFPSLAWTGSELGVSWSDNRDGNNEIYFTRVSAGGTEIGDDIRLTADGSSSTSPSLTWTGSEFGLSWNDNRNGDYQIYFTRVSAGGAEIGDDIRLTADASISTSPSLTWTGSEFGVSWEDYRDGNSEISFTRVSAGGTEIGDDVRLAAAASTLLFAPSLTWTGSEFGVSWHDSRDGNWEIYFTRVSAIGTEIGNDIRLTTDDSSSQYPSLTWTGSELGVSWQDSRDGNYEIYFALIGYDLDGDGLATTQETGLGTDPNDWDTDDDGISDGYEVLTAGTNPLDPDTDGDGLSDGYEVLIAGTDPLDPDTDGDGFEDGADCSPANARVHPGAREICDGVDNQCPGDPGFGYTDANCDCNLRLDIRVDLDPASRAMHSSIATDRNNNSIITWEDERNGGWDIYARVYDSWGNPLKDDFRVDQDAGTGWAETPSIATDLNNNFIITWQDNRNGNYDIYARRFDSSGIPLGNNFRVDQGAGTATASDPSIATDQNNNFIITWQDSRNGNFDIYARRFDSSGNPLGNDFRVDQDAGTAEASYASIATDQDNNFVISWQDYRNGSYDIYARRYDSFGNPLGNDFRVDQDAGTADASITSIAADQDNNFIITWSDSRNGNFDIYARRYDSSGIPLGNDFRVDQDAGSANASYGSIAVDQDNNFIITWTDYRNGNYDIYARRYNSSGSPLGSDFRVDLDAGTADVLFPSIAADRNNNFIITWGDSRNGNSDIYARRYDSSGNSLGNDFRVDQEAGTAEAWYPSIAADMNNNFIITWSDHRSFFWHIYAHRYDSSGNPLGINFQVDQHAGTADLVFPSIATDRNNNFIITWQDYGNGNYDIYARRYDSSGNPLGNDFRVDQDAGTAYAQHPSVATDQDNNFIITWDDARSGNLDIYARRYDSSGSPLGNEFRVDQDTGTADARFPSIATDRNNNFIITWHESRNVNFDIYARRYDSSGNPLGNDFRVDQDAGTGWAETTSIATDQDDNFIITWGDRRSGNSDIYVRRFDSTGNPLGNEFRVDQGAGTADASFPSIAADQDNNFIITWHDSRNGNYDIYARRYDSSGNPLGNDFRVDQDTGTAVAQYPSIATDLNDNFIITWHENRIGTHGVYFSFPFIDSDCDHVIDVIETLGHCMDIIDPDSDGDGLCDGDTSSYDGAYPICLPGENLDLDSYFGIYDNETHPCLADTDDDGMGDFWEVANSSCVFPLTGDSTLDPDFDGLTNIIEYQTGTAPCDYDTDGDGLEDWLELLYDTDPTLADTDGDGISDSEEALYWLTNPASDDTDGDEIPDGWESAYACLDPLVTDASADPDGDGLDNAAEFAASSDPCAMTDTDGDGMSDWWEDQYACVDSLTGDSTGDPDADGRSSLQEYLDRTDPCTSNLIPQTLNLVSYQGRLMDDAGAAVGGTVDMAFSLFDGETGGTPLWSEHHQVRVENGIYDLLLGGDTVIPSSALTLPELWLQVSVSGEVLVPRQKITAVLHAINADLMDGKRLETGTRVLTVSPAAGIRTMHVAFDRPFSAPPRVVVTYPDGLIGTETFVGSRIYNVTTTGFEVEWKSLSGTPAAGSAGFGYYAFGE